MLKGIPNIISPELLKILMEMGHGDELVISDGNFPSTNCAKRLIRADGHNALEILSAILELFPLDTYIEKPVTLMSVLPGDSYNPIIWNDYKKIIIKNFNHFSDFDYVDRYSFYERAKKSYAIIATSEKSLYANLILTKGVL